MKLIMVLVIAVAALFTGCSRIQEKVFNGKKSSSIKHGSEVNGGRAFANHLVAIVNEGEAICTGVIIAEDAVVTAAHCAEEVRHGQLGFGLNKETFVAREIKAFKRHEEYDRNVAGASGDIGDEATNDVLVIKFTGGLPDGYVPVRIPDEDQLREKDIVMLAGYGRDENNNYDVLKAIEVPVAEVVTYEFKTDEKQGGSCDGDSGGPAFARANSGEYVLVGVTSRGDMNCSKHGVYEKAAFYKRWIFKSLAAL